MSSRQPHVAGAFYPGTARQCEEMLDTCVGGGPFLAPGEHRLVAGIVPHAGWIYSGPTAGKVFGAFREAGGVDTFILFGAVHVWGVEAASLWPEGSWISPLGEAFIDESLAAGLLDDLGERLVAEPASHRQEHSIEVQLPFIQRLFPEARIVPIMVPPLADAGDFGRAVARAIAARCGRRRVAAIASTDLTHYGPNYRFMPMGIGAKALTWVKEENDRRILELALRLEEDDIVDEAEASHNACGAGAMAAATGYAHQMGAASGRLLDYTTSYDVLPERNPSSFVGYAGIVFDTVP